MDSINLRTLPLHKPVILSSDDTLKQAAFAMKAQNVGSVLISRKGKGLVGIVTDRDLAFLLGLRGFTSSMKLNDAVDKPLAAVAENNTLADVIILMKENGIRRVPVLSASKHCIGVIALDDLIKEGLLGQEDSENILKIQLKKPSRSKAQSRVVKSMRKINRREQSYFNFLGHIATATNLNRADARHLILYTLGAFLGRMTSTEGKDLVSQLPYLLQAELMSEISLPDPSITTSDIVVKLSERFNKSQAETKILMRAFWRALSELIARNETKQAAAQMPKDMQTILGE